MKAYVILRIVLFVFLVLLVTAITLIIVFFVRNKKYKNFVLQNSDSIKKLCAINKEYVFRQYTKNQSLYYKFDNKRNWYNTQPIDFFSRDVRNNIERWMMLKEDVDFNNELFKKYQEAVQNAYVPISENLCKENGFIYKKAKKIEKKQFESLIQKPAMKISILVRLRYVSPKGQVDESKRETFGYVELKRILDSVSTRRVSKETYDRLARAERGILSDSLRYDVLKRDNFRCVLCGMSSKDGAILHVDHIVPVSKGGKTEIDNLRTLCEKCNIGKSNKIE